MIDWWGVAHNTLWILGLALGLAALNWALYVARRERIPVRHALTVRSFTLPFNAGLTLVCAGLAFSAQAWWETALWALLALLFTVQAVPKTGFSFHAPDGFPQESPAGSVTWQSSPEALHRSEPGGHKQSIPKDAPLAPTPADLGIILLLLMLPVTLWATALPELSRPQAWRMLAGVALYYGVANWATRGRPTRRLTLALLGIALAGLSLAAYGLVTAEWIIGKLGFLPAALYQRLPSLAADVVHPNVLGGALALLLPLPLAALLFGSRGLSWPGRLTATVATLGMAAVLLITQSRGALLATAAALGLLASLRWRWGWLAVALLAAGGGALVVVLGPRSVLEAISVGGSVRNLDGRLEIWSRALYMIQDFAITGAGLGAFGRVADLLYPFFLAAPGTVTHAHNLYLQVAVDLGLPGLIAWLSILLALAAAAWTTYRRGSLVGDRFLAGLGAGLLAAQVALAVHGFVDAPLWGEMRTAPLVWGLWGLAAAAATAHNSTCQPPHMSRLPRSPRRC